MFSRRWNCFALGPGTPKISLTVADREQPWILHGNKRGIFPLNFLWVQKRVRWANLHKGRIPEILPREMIDHHWQRRSPAGPTWLQTPSYVPGWPAECGAVSHPFRFLGSWSLRLWFCLPSPGRGPRLRWFLCLLKGHLFLSPLPWA